MRIKRLSWDELLAYYGWNILTLGLVWVIKIIIKKAIIESYNNHVQE